MKQFISFVRKEFYHIFRDRRTMLILLGMPVVQIILFGFAITTEVKNVKVAVLDFSKSLEINLYYPTYYLHNNSKPFRTVTIEYNKKE